MKFYESTSFFFRVVIAKYNIQPYDIDIKLMPMFHIGEEAFYKSIFEHANECDKVLCEGLRLNKLRIDKQIGRFTKSAAKLGLVSQFEFFQKNKLLTKVIKADLNGKIAKKEWQKLRFSEKIKYRIVNPVRFRLETIGLTRKKLSKAFMTSSEDAYLAYGPIEEEGTLQNLIYKVRDSIVAEKLKQEISVSNKNKLIGIMFGAGHMRRIESFILQNYDAHMVKAEFLKVYHL